MEHGTSGLLHVLTNAPDTAARVDGLNRLTALIERSHGPEAEALGAVLRSTGAVEQICSLVDDAAPSVHLRAMSILGNLVADVFDPRAVESVVLASKAGVLPRLLARLGDASFPATLYAAACLQNMTSVDGGVCDFLNGHGGARVLEAMLRQPGQEELVQFASGTLANMLSRGAAELEDEGATRASLAAAAQQRREQDAAARIVANATREPAPPPAAAVPPAPVPATPALAPTLAPEPELVPGPHSRPQPQPESKLAGATPLPRASLAADQMEHGTSGLLHVLTNAPDTAARVDGLNRLTALIERSHGPEAEALGAVLRSTGAVEQICSLVDDAAPSVHLRAMSILGNLVADVFDPRAVESVVLASKAGVLPRLLARLGDASFPATLYAAACLQNMTSVDGGVCDFLNGHGGARVLEAMLRQPGQEELVQFASGTLANMLSRGAAELEDEGATRASLAAAAQQRREQDAAGAEAGRADGAEALRVEHASKVVQRAVRGRNTAEAETEAQAEAQAEVEGPLLVSEDGPFRGTAVSKREVVSST